MPDVTRSDSQRSDTSLRPRVSFNRDVHVKRIVPRESARVVEALIGDGAGHLATSPIRKERLAKSKQQLAEEAARVIHQADKLDCISQDKGVYPEKFYTLPSRKKHKPVNDYQLSLDRKSRRRRNSAESLSDFPPKKPPRIHAIDKPPEKTKNSLFNIFKEENGRKSNLKRSVSDASHLRLKANGDKNDNRPLKNLSGSDIEDNLSDVRANKKLSPIIENAPKEDYFAPNSDKENVKIDENIEDVESVTKKLKQYIDEVDGELYKETGRIVDYTPKNEKLEPEVVIIDVDKAEKITSKKGNKKSIINTGIIKKKIKSFANKKNKKNLKPVNNVKEIETNSRVLEKSNSVSDKEDFDFKELPHQPAPKIKEAIESLEKQAKHSQKMIHSSQKPAEKLPLTKGKTVDNMVRRLSNDKCFQTPPKTNIMVTPSVTVQHNNNQPFSYTRGLSPEKTYANNSRSPQGSSSPVIYAQVVCGNGGSKDKQTIHTVYSNGKKHLPHSDSDEGLGYEETSGYNKKIVSEKHSSHYMNSSYQTNNKISKEDFYNDNSRFDEEFPITPKFKSNGYRNGFDSYEKKYKENFGTERNVYIDSSSRGRGDGMDAKRKESLTEPFESEGIFSENTTNLNGRSDLSARRDLLESRINKRLGEKTTHKAYMYSSDQAKYYASNSNSPTGYKEKYISETKINERSDPKHYEIHNNKKYFGDNFYERNNFNGFESEPKSFDSQISDYRSSPENKHFESSHPDHGISKYKYTSNIRKQQIYKDKGYYKSNPEIYQRQYDERDKHHESYHDSLKREKYENKVNRTQYFDHNESERRDKFGDSGIENDFKRDSADSFYRQRRELYNESEDEGFASSLLIASERQHTDDNFHNRKQRHDYDSDKGYSHDDNYEMRPNNISRDYAHRERSIDDGSHFDPRIDKIPDKDRADNKRYVDKKPPKPEKKSSLEKMKQLFTRDSKKHKKDKGMVREESLRARYTEYKGSREVTEPKFRKKGIDEVNTNYTNISNRRRLSTPSPSPTRERNEKNENTHGSWFKSLDRLSRKKSKKIEKETLTEDEISVKPNTTKNLRFFGDTDIESNGSIRHKPYGTRPDLSNINGDRIRSQSSRELHNITEESRSPILANRKSNHKSMQNISESSKDTKESRISLKPPMSPNHRTNRYAFRTNNERGRRKKNEVSSVESSTEGDSSQQSQKSVVYLHAATVGDIPGPGHLRNGRRTASREELTSNSSVHIQPQVKTLSRSFSVLAPWKPHHYRDSMDIDYTQYPKSTKNGKYEQKVSKNGRKDNSTTLKKKAQETRRSNQNVSTLNRRSRSKENISSQNLRRSKEEITKGSTSTLFKKKERPAKENTRYTKDREEKRMSSKSMSVESLGNNSRSSKRSHEANKISRSMSMPRDPEKSSGWFSMNRKSKKSVSSQRL